jgi:hypothetical protein
MIKFIGPLYSWLQQFTDHYLTHCHLPIGHSTGAILTSSWTPLYSFVLLKFWSELRLTLPSYNSSARTRPKTAPSLIKNVCLFFPYLTMSVLLLTVYASGMCLTSRCLAVGIYVTVLILSYKPIKFCIYICISHLKEMSPDFLITPLKMLRRFPSEVGWCRKTWNIALTRLSEAHFETDMMKKLTDQNIISLIFPKLIGFVWSLASF